jgi:hypothetical protein
VSAPSSTVMNGTLGPEPVELGDDERPLRLAGGLDGGGELRPPLQGVRASDCRASAIRPDFAAAPRPAQ